MRRYVEWRINVGEHDYECIRHENGQVHLIGRAPQRSLAEGIVACDRLRVLHDPLSFEVRPVEYRVR